jgi:hypothetical protein
MFGGAPDFCRLDNGLLPDDEVSMTDYEDAAPDGSGFKAYAKTMPTFD